MYICRLSRKILLITLCNESRMSTLPSQENVDATLVVVLEFLFFPVSLSLSLNLYFFSIHVGTLFVARGKMLRLLLYHNLYYVRNYKQELPGKKNTFTPD